MRTEPKVLVVDDDAGVRHAMATRLGAIGFDVRSAGSGAEALSLIRQEHLDAALIDVMIPDLDGFAICEQLRKQEGCEHIPVFLLTGASDGIVRNHLDTLTSVVGGTHFITKPCDGKALAERIWSAVQPKVTATSEN